MSTLTLRSKYLALSTASTADIIARNRYQVFNLSVPKQCTNVPDELLNPSKGWTGTASFDDEVKKLGNLFNENFKKYSDEATEEVIKAGPQV